MAILTAVLLLVLVGGVAVVVLARQRRTGPAPRIERGHGDVEPQPWQSRADALSQAQPSMHPQGRDPHSQAPDTARD